MDDIRAVLRIAAHRLELNSFLDRAHWAAIGAGAIALALIIADRLGSSSFIPWFWVAPVLVVLALLAALLLWSRRRRSDLQVAMAVDERLDLREKLSTALHCEGRTDPFAQAAVADAVQTARDGRTREATRRRFRLAPPHGWWISPLLVLVAMMVSLLNPLDLFSDEEQDPATSYVDAKNQAQETVQAVVREIEESPELAKSMEDLLGRLATEEIDPRSARADDPEQVKRDALKKVSEINKRLEEILTGEQAKTADALKSALQQLNTPEDGVTKDLTNALSRGDFSDAQKALKEMMDKVQKGEMNEEQRQQAQEQLENLAKQLEQLAQQQQQLEQALQQAGLDPALAQNPQALQQALQNNPNLNEQQRQQLQQMAQAQQAACKMCQNLGQAAGQLAQAMQQGQQPGQQGQMGQQMSDQLSQMEQLQQLMNQAQAAANSCQGQCQGLGQGLGLQQFMQQGGGMGQRGQGRGGKAPNSPTPWGSKKVKADIKTDPEGGIIARMFVDGPEFVGESHIAAEQVVVDLLEGYDEATIEERLPRIYHEPHKHYFGELKKLTEARAEEGEAGAAEGEGGGEADEGEGE